MSSPTNTLSRKEMKKQKNREAMKQDESKHGLYAGVACLVIVGAGLIQFFAMTCGKSTIGSGLAGAPGGIHLGKSGPVSVFDVSKSEQVKKTLFEGKNVVVFCQNDKSEGSAVPNVIKELSAELMEHKATADVEVVSANCFKKMENGKSLAQTYNFGKKDGFVAVFANNKKPVQLNYFPTGKYVAKQIRPMVKTAVNRVVYLRDFEQSCQGRKNCVLLSSKNKENLSRMEAMVKPHISTHRDLAFASVDSGFYKVSVDADFAKQKPAQEENAQYGEAICVAKSSHDDDFAEFMDPKGFMKKQQSAKKVLKAKFLPSWTDADLTAFLNECSENKAENWYELKQDVSIKARSGETKHIKAAKNPHLKSAAADAEDGTKKGKERVGRRPDEKFEDEEEEEEEGDDEEEGDEEEEEEGEEVEL